MKRKSLKIKSEKQRQNAYHFIANWIKNTPFLKEELINVIPNLSLEAIEEQIMRLMKGGYMRVVSTKRGHTYLAYYHFRMKMYTYKDNKRKDHIVKDETFVEFKSKKQFKKWS